MSIRIKMAPQSYNFKMGIPSYHLKINKNLERLFRSIYNANNFLITSPVINQIVKDLNRTQFSLQTSPAIAELSKSMEKVNTIYERSFANISTQHLGLSAQRIMNAIEPIKYTMNYSLGGLVGSQIGEIIETLDLANNGWKSSISKFVEATKIATSENQNYSNNEEIIDDLANEIDRGITSLENKIKEALKFDGIDEGIEVHIANHKMNLAQIPIIVSFFMLLLQFISLVSSSASNKKLIKIMSTTENNIEKLVEEQRKTNELLIKKLNESDTYSLLRLTRDSTVRNEPTSKSDSLGIINKGIQVYLIENGNRWHQILYYGSTEEEFLMGWVYKGNLEIIN